MEALERARAAYGTGAYDDATIEFLFPEVKESEDERVRKFLVKHVSEWIGCIEHDLKISSKDIESEEELAMFKAGLAYLEEQKPLSTEETELNSIAFLEQMGYTCVPPGKEQKPAEWSEEDKVMLNIIEYRLKDWGSIKAQHGYQDNYDFLSPIKWLKSLPKRFVPQPKQEWSEQDEKMKESIIKALYGGGHFAYEPEITWLKSLRPHWKPSEQEKGALRTAIHILTDERSFPKAAGHLQAILDAFEGKESRKEWKPSEEQMNRLSSIIAALRKDYCDDMADFLASIYRNLEKLI